MLIDIVFAIAMVMACIKGYQKGLIVALFSVVAFIVGLAAALKLSAVVAGWLQSSTSVSAQWLPVLSFALVFLAVVLLVRWGGRLIQKSVEAVLLGWVNRIGGILLFAVLYIIILSILLFYAQKLQLIKPETVAASATASFIQPWGPAVIDNFGKVIPLFKDTFSDLEQFFANIGQQLPR
jgi:membrane protein required for colicin V production